MTSTGVSGTSFNGISLMQSSQTNSWILYISVLNVSAHSRDLLLDRQVFLPDVGSETVPSCDPRHVKAVQSGHSRQAVQTVALADETNSALKVYKFAFLI